VKKERPPAVMTGQAGRNAPVNTKRTKLNNTFQEIWDKMTLEGDLVLVHMDGQPAFFARIEAINPDVKPNWYQVKILVLQIPLVVITWILRDPYINGEEFTMGGRPIKLVKVVAPEQEAAPSPSEESGKSAAPAPSPQKSSGAEKVVSLADRRKKDHLS